MITAHRVGRPGSSDGGTGPLIVFVHGIEDGWQSWQPLASLIDPSWRCVALEMPWRAGNDYRWRRLRTSGGWLSAALADLELQPAVLAGHSFGAGAVLELLAAGQERFAAGTGPRAATLISPACRLPGLELTWRVFDRSRSYFEAQIRQGLRLRLDRRAAAIDPALRDAITDKAFDRIGPAGFVAVFEQFAASGDLDLGSVRTPVLVLSGQQDPSLSARGAARLASLMPAATVVREENFDHFCHVRQASDVAAHLNRFLLAVAGERSLP